MKNVILGVVGTILIITIAVLGFLLWRSGQINNGYSMKNNGSKLSQNNMDKLSQENTHTKNLRSECENNGGEFMNIKCDANGDNCDYTCTFVNGKKCGEFGWNKCVDSKGEWQAQLDFKKSSDKDFGISFEYPKKYTVNKKSYERRIYREDKYINVDTINIRVAGQNMGPQMIISKSKKKIVISENLETDGDGNKIEDKLINGVRYQKFQLTGMGEPYGYFAKQGDWYYTFEIAFAPKGDSNAQEFENIMKSVKFIK